MPLPDEEINREMFVVTFSTKSIHSVFATHESKSGDSILTEYGSVMRTSTKERAIFNSYKFAKLAILMNDGDINDESRQLAKDLGLRFVKTVEKEI